MVTIFIRNNEIFIYTIERNSLQELIKKLRKLGIEGEFKIVYCG
jgi:UDP-N-acetylglucosamine enolpyruvyl transferase